MFSIRFIALVAASVATLTLANVAAEREKLAVNAANTASVPDNATSVSAPDADGDYLYMCQTRGFQHGCDYVGFLANACTAVPPRQVNNMDSVRIPSGWICVFYECDPKRDLHTTILAPGTDDMWMHRFNDQVDDFKCFRR
ncbi:hypothetical protein B0H13DRAFT_1913246 [Mycena leptocephala]|nr:hypothetical protein B0H13DRAFT_1913246 [Mycena leptocephala]